MCVLFLWIQPSSRYVLVAASNRDTFLGKETANATFWDDHPEILAGRDMVAGGTWIGISSDGKFAAVTNIPSPYQGTKKTNIRSRGLMVSSYLQRSCSETPLDYCQSVLSHAGLYSGFNLITAKLSPTVEAAYSHNRHITAARTLTPGVHGLSNQLLNSPVKKLVQGKPRFAEIVSDLESGALDQAECERQLLNLLFDETCLYPDENYPALGFPERTLRHLSSVFVTPTELYGEAFGTRTNTVVMVTASGEVTYTERTRLWPVDLAQPQWETNRFSFRI